MAKIVLSFYNAVLKANLSEMPCFYEGFVKGLLDAGNNVLVFSDYGRKRPHAKDKALVSEAIKKFNPDVVIAFNNYGPDYANLVDCPIIVYEVDSPIFYENTNSIQNFPSRYKFIVCQLESRSFLTEHFNVPTKNIWYTPFFSEVKACNTIKHFNISFIGSPFSNGHPHWLEWGIRQKKISNKLKLLYLDLLSDIRKNPFDVMVAKSSKYKALCLDISDVYKLIGDLSAEKRIMTLSSVADLGLTIFGPKEWKKVVQLNPNMFFAYNPKRLFSLKQNQDLYNASKICLNINHLQAKSGFSWRVCDIMASSGCLVTEYNPCFKSLFPKVPIPTFTNRFEAREKCVYLLREDNYRLEIIEKCQTMIDQNYRFKNILPIIQDAANIKLYSTAKGYVDFIGYTLKNSKNRGGGGGGINKCYQVPIYVYGR